MLRIMSLDAKTYSSEMVTQFFPDLTKDTEDILYVYAGPVGSFMEKSCLMIATRIRNSVNSHTKILFDNMLEGEVEPNLHKIYNILSLLEINRDNVYYLTSAFDANYYHNIYCKKYNISNKIHIYVSNAWEWLLTSYSSSKSSTIIIKIKNKNFLCFNRMLRPKRLALATILESKQLIDGSFYSLFSELYDQENVLDNTITQLKSSINDEEVFNKILFGSRTLRKRLPLTLTINDHNQNVNYIIDEDIRLFDDSYFSVVTETNFFPYNDHNNLEKFANEFFSEKTYKPIIMKHPFVLLAPSNSLSNLKRIGYKTFSPWIDESYDNEKDHTKRLVKVVNEIERLCKQTPEQWINWQKGIAEIVEYNYSVLINRKITDYAIERH